MWDIKVNFKILFNLRNIEVNAEGLSRLYTSLKGLGYKMTIGFGSWTIETIKWIINLGKKLLDYLKNKFWMLKKMK